MPYPYEVPGVDLDEFVKCALHGCYQGGKTYGADYAYHLLGKFLYLSHVVEEKRNALKKVNLKEIAQKVQEINEKNKNDDPVSHQKCTYTRENRIALNEVRRPLIEYQIALQSLCDCCMAMDVDKNIKTGESEPDEKNKHLGVIRYDKFNQWRDERLGELAEWEREANSVGGYKAVSDSFNCMAYASGANKHLSGLPFASRARFQVQSAGYDLFALPRSGVVGNLTPEDWRSDFGMQVGKGGISRDKSFASTTEISDSLLEDARKALEREGFDVEVHPITDSNYASDPKEIPRKPGSRRMLLMYQLASTSKPGALNVLDYHFAGQDPKGHWSDKPGDAWVFGEEQGRNPTGMTASDTYQVTTGKFCRPAKKGDPQATHPCAMGTGVIDTPSLPVAYLDLSDDNRLFEKYKLLRSPKTAQVVEWRKQSHDIETRLSDNKVTAEVYKEPQKIRYQTFGQLGRAFLKDHQLTADKLNAVTEALQNRQNKKEYNIKALVEKLIPGNPLVYGWVLILNRFFQAYPEDTNPSLVTPLASIIKPPVPMNENTSPSGASTKGGFDVLVSTQSNASEMVPFVPAQNTEAVSTLSHQSPMVTTFSPSQATSVLQTHKAG